MCSAEFKATLTLEVAEGEASITLTAGLYHLRPLIPHQQDYVNPSRQKKRRAAVAAENQCRQVDAEQARHDDDDYYGKKILEQGQNMAETA